jgi:hypothetical protein
MTKKANIKCAVRRVRMASSEAAGKYSMLLAYDVPCYGSIEFTSKSDVAAVRKGKRMLEDWDKHIADVPFMDEQGGADQHRIVSLTHMPTQRVVAEDVYMAPQPCPKVLVYVCGGVAEYFVEGAVEIALIDIDNIDAGDPPVKLDESWRKLTQNCFPQEESKYVRIIPVSRRK